MVTRFPEKFPEEEIFVRLTQEANQALAFAQEESRRLSHKVVGTEQILLGLIAEETGLAAQALKSKGMNLKNTRSEVERILSGGSTVGDSEIPFSPTAKQSLKLSLEAALKLGHQEIDTGHLLLGLIYQGRQGEGVAVWILHNFKVDLEKLEQQILLHLKDSKLAKASMIRCTAGGPALSSYEPLDLVSSEIATRLIYWLISWVDTRKLGRVFSSNTGFKLPNGDILALGISFISRELLKQNPRTYTELAPDLVIEIKSSNQQLLSLQAKIQRLLNLGVLVGVLVAPDDRTVIIYRANGEVTLLTDGDTLTIPEVLPGWKLPVSNVWPPGFD